MPRKKVITEELVVEQQAAGETIQTNDTVEPLSRELALAALRRAKDMVEAMNQSHWQLNSTAIRQNLVNLIQYSLDYVKEQGDAN